MNLRDKQSRRQTPEEEGVEADQSQCDLTPPETVAGLARENPAEQEEVSSSTLKRALTKDPLKVDEWPESEAKRKEAVVTTIEEEVDTATGEDLIEGELNGDRKLKRKDSKSKVSAHQKKGIWGAITKEVWTLGAFDRWSTQCLKQWEDLRCWARKMVEAQLGLASQRRRGARRTLTP
ncbi:hypothetical protein NDU88_004268 [Pleurodeles waltl]|uniref:Uncharacterized protein n=1 Tax=Pleurodeles waltl TaxID=8319 RepID=A0AAV7TQT8_PLEWA|nr:hypothetical protein NDU88_004268 [Pleurodeles waltl]